MKNISIKSRLLRILLIPLLFGFLLVGLAAYFNTKHEAEEMYDAQMSHLARTLELMILREIAVKQFTTEEVSSQNKINIKYNISAEDYSKNFAYRIWVGEKIVYRSLNSKDFSGFPEEEGFFDIKLNDKDWRFLVIKDGSVTIEVAENYTAREDLVNRILASIFIPLIIMIPLVLLTVIYGLNIGLKPLSSLSNAVSRRNANDLHPIDKNNIPKEVEPLVDNLNNLMAKIKEAFAKEKRFTSYAAHELRTPLAALKAQIQVALRHRDLAKQKEMFTQTTVGIDRMSHLVEQLLTLMRVQEGNINKQEFNFSDLLTRIIEDFKPKVKSKNLTIVTNITSDINIKANAEMIEIMLNNLIANAIKYTEGEGNIEISLSSEDSGVNFSIANPSKKMSESDLQKMFEPFHRLKGEIETGAGIGLSIVRWIVDAHKGIIKNTFNHNRLEFAMVFSGL